MEHRMRTCACHRVADLVTSEAVRIVKGVGRYEFLRIILQLLEHFLSLRDQEVKGKGRVAHSLAG